MNEPTLAMSLGGPEMMMIFAIVLLLFGAKKLPQLAKGLGQASGELKKARLEVEREIKDAAATVETDRA